MKAKTSPNQWKALPKSEEERLLKLTELERKVQGCGFKRIAGVDEAGRGPLAGPVVAAACLIEEGYLLPGIDDSKQLTSLQRKELFDKITTSSHICYAVGIVEPEEIDRINILQATFKAMQEAVSMLSSQPDYLLVDGHIHPFKQGIPALAVVRGDSHCHCIAAASIIAKVVRDKMMIEYHEQYPIYGFKDHKGYATKKHIEAIEQHGPCVLHRFSFSPVSNFCKTTLRKIT